MNVDAWLRLALTPGLGPVRLRRLIEAVGSPQEACNADARLLERLDGIAGRTARDIERGLRASADLAAQETSKARAMGVQLVSRDDELYPPLLLQIPDPPPVLWTWGQLEPRDLNAIGIVGSRRPSHYGKEQAERFGSLLAGAGFTVVSGGAYGIDACAHRGALRVMEGRTIAVLGCGVDIAYPPENTEMFQQIADGGGAVVSEHPLGTNPRREHFPRRNRIISGMARGVLVIEAGEQSGALITARQAGEDHNRPVFALPGRVDNPMAAGPHALLRNGACLVAELEDILDNLHPLPAGVYEVEPSIAAESLFDVDASSNGAPAVVAPPASLSEVDRQILDTLAGGGLGIDALVDVTGLPASQVQAAAMMLGIRGYIVRGSDGRFERKR